MEKITMTKWNERGGLSLAKAVQAAYARGEDDYHMPPLVALLLASLTWGVIDAGTGARIMSPSTRRFHFPASSRG